MGKRRKRIWNNTDNKTGVSGVHFDNTVRSWTAQIHIDGAPRHLHQSKDFTEAVAQPANGRAVTWGTDADTDSQS